MSNSGWIGVDLDMFLIYIASWTLLATGVEIYSDNQSVGLRGLKITSVARVAETSIRSYTLLSHARFAETYSSRQLEIAQSTPHVESGSAEAPTREVFEMVTGGVVSAAVASWQCPLPNISTGGIAYSRGTNSHALDVDAGAETSRLTTLNRGHTILS